MDLQTLDVPRELAEQRLAAYRAMRAEERTAEDREIARGYRMAAEGRPIIRLSDAITAGGIFASGLPKIAVVRADAQTCSVEVDPWRASVRGRRVIVFYSGELPDGERRNRGALIGRGRWGAIPSVRVDTPALTAEIAWNVRRDQGSTIAPVIPPDLRPRRNRLHLFHVLFEVERWATVNRAGRAPGDPALIRHIGGDLWSVHAVWDLTELERAVLEARA